MQSDSACHTKHLCVLYQTIKYWGSPKMHCVIRRAELRTLICLRAALCQPFTTCMYRATCYLYVSCIALQRLNSLQTYASADFSLGTTTPRTSVQPETSPTDLSSKAEGQMRAYRNNYTSLATQMRRGWCLFLCWLRCPKAHVLAPCHV